MHEYDSSLQVLRTPGHTRSHEVVARVFEAWDHKDGFMGAELGGLVEECLITQTGISMRELTGREDRVESLKGSLVFAMFTNWGDETRDSLETLRSRVSLALRDYEGTVPGTPEAAIAASLRAHVDTLEIRIIDE